MKTKALLLCLLLVLLIFLWVEPGITQPAQKPPEAKISKTKDCTAPDQVSAMYYFITENVETSFVSKRKIYKKT